MKCCWSSLNMQNNILSLRTLAWFSSGKDSLWGGILMVLKIAAAWRSSLGIFEWMFEEYGCFEKGQNWLQRVRGAEGLNMRNG